MRRLMVVLAVGAAAFGITTAVQASIPDGNAIVHACYTTNNLQGYPPGALRARDTAKINGQVCFQNEAPVDLATPQYVQNVVTSTVNQTAIVGRATFASLPAGNWWINWNCGGWVATNPTVGPDPEGTATSSITVRGTTNVELQSNGFAGTNAKVYFSTSVTQNIHTQVTCIDPRVYGETAPVAGPAQVKATVTAQ